MNSLKSYLMPKDVGRMLRVTSATVRLWAESGELKAHMTAGGHRRFALEDVEQFARDKHVELNNPAELAGTS